MTTTSCAHCEHLRREQQAALDEFGDDRYPGLYASDYAHPMTKRVQQGWGNPPTKPPMATCRCDCHVPARISGLLPRLKATA